MHVFDGFGEMLKTMQLAHPQWLWLLLLLIPYVAWQIWKRHRRYGTVTVSTTEPFPKAPRSFRYFLRPLPLILRCLAFGVLVFALARPQTSGKKVTANSATDGIDIVIALDVSGSMDATDFAPTRLKACREIAANFVDGRPDDNLGLVLYAGEAYTLCPPTNDHSYFKKMVKQAQREPLEDGTAIGDGLALAVSHLKDSKSKSKVVILLSDGVNNTGFLDPTKADSMAIAHGVKVYTISCGTNGKKVTIYDPKYGPYTMITEVDEKLLTDIAVHTGGKHFVAKDKKSLEKIYQEIDKMEKTHREYTNVVTWKHEEFFPFLLMGILLLCVEFFLRIVVLRSHS